MAQTSWFRSFAMIAMAFTLSLTMSAQGDPAAIQQRLSAQFKLTTITADRTDIVTAGDVVALHKPGLVMYAVTSPLPPSNTYKNGKIGQGWGGFGKDLQIGMATGGGGTAADYPHRLFVAEEKCWVTGIQVEKDGVVFQLYSDPYNEVRYYASLKVPFPNKKQVPSVDVALQTVAEVLTVAPTDNQGAQPAQAAAPATPRPPSSGANGRNCATASAGRSPPADDRDRPDTGPGNRSLRTTPAGSEVRSEANLLLQGHEGDLHQRKSEQRGISSPRIQKWTAA